MAGNPKSACSCVNGWLNAFAGRTVLLLLVCVFVIAGDSVAHSPGAKVAFGGLERFENPDGELGGDFELTDQFRKRVKLSQYRGKIVLIIFGYTACPDVCPTTLNKIKRVSKALGKSAASVRVMFVTVDPERDTSERLKKYLTHFGEDYIGLTGNEREIKAVAAKFNVRSEKIGSGSKARYFMGHTSFIFLLNRAGKVKYLLPPNIHPRVIRDGVKLLLDGKT